MQMVAFGKMSRAFPLAVLALTVMGLGLILAFPPVIEVVYDKEFKNVTAIRPVGRPDRTYRDDIARDMCLFIELKNGEKVIFHVDRGRQIAECGLIVAFSALAFAIGNRVFAEPK